MNNLFCDFDATTGAEGENEGVNNVRSQRNAAVGPASLPVLMSEDSADMFVSGVNDDPSAHCRFREHIYKSGGSQRRV